MIKKSTLVKKQDTHALGLTAKLMSFIAKKMDL